MKKIPENWTTPFPGHRVIGPLYAVGTAGLGVFLITTDQGHILINTGWEDSAKLIRENIESVGYRLEDVKILLTMQSHDDHTADLANIKAEIGAEMWAMEADIRILEDGGLSDPHFGGQQLFTPIAVDKALNHGDVIEFGGISLAVHEHPGHTEGSCSYSMQVTENGRQYNVAIANMGTINKGKRLLVDPTYPGVADDFALTFFRQKAMDVDVWVSAHAGHYSRDKKYSPGQQYNPDTFVDPEGFLEKIEQLETVYLNQLASEQG